MAKNTRQRRPRRHIDDAEPDAQPDDPHPDSDGDGIADLSDDCPGVPEDLDGDADTDGCPEEGVAILRPTAIEITEQIRFQLDSAVITPDSAPIIAAVATMLANHPDIAVLRVEGHASAEGTSKHNQDLSVARAQAVLEALVSAGVARQRLVAEGFGESRPLMPGTDPAALQANRRVEFHIVP
jgi:outer membrane protein OmpA-like peptidoglycan-associated protein